MNVFTEGVRGAIRSPLRACAIITMLEISVKRIVAIRQWTHCIASVIIFTVFSEKTSKLKT